MGKWIKDPECEGVLHYFADEEVAERRKRVGLPVWGDGLVERGRFGIQGNPPFIGFWYAIPMGQDGATGHFYELDDAKKWIEEQVAGVEKEGV